MAKVKNQIVIVNEVEGSYKEITQIQDPETKKYRDIETIEEAKQILEDSSFKFGVNKIIRRTVIETVVG